MKLEVPPLNLEYHDGMLYRDDQPCKADIRTLGQMKDLLFDVDFASDKDPNTPTYYMYRDLVPELKEDGMRYDITIILPTTLGSEFNKTFGHYHPIAADELSYTELYNILEGEAHYLLQRQRSDGLIDKAMIVKAKKGDCVVMPPNFGHITINPGKEPLIMANLVYPNFSSQYTDYEMRRGGAYYELANGKIIPNPHYSMLTKLETKKAGCKQSFKPNILAAYKKNPKAFEFLKDPRLYKE